MPGNTAPLLKDLRKTCATYATSTFLSSIEILGHSVGGITLSSLRASGAVGDVHGAAPFSAQNRIHPTSGTHCLTAFGKSPARSDEGMLELG